MSLGVSSSNDIQLYSILNKSLVNLTNEQTAQVLSNNTLMSGKKEMSFKALVYSNPVHTEHFKCEDHLPGLERTITVCAEMMKSCDCDNSVNLLGQRMGDFATTELYAMLQKAGVKIGLQLPLVTEEDDIPLIGRSTETAIQAGVVNGIVYEMDGYIDELKVKYPDLLVFLTGGHSFYFERRLKNSIFADINLVLTGLNRILEYNVEN